MSNLVPSNDKIEEALKESSGLITYAARKLRVPVEVLKKQVRKNKQLRNLMLELRESAIDLAEDTLMWRMREKKDGIVAMFVLKCIGKHRGWVDKPDKAGESLDKPVYIKILPAGVDNGENGEKKVGRPKKATYPTLTAIAPAVKEDDEAIIDVDIVS